MVYLVNLPTIVVSKIIAGTIAQEQWLSVVVELN